MLSIRYQFTFHVYVPSKRHIHSYGWGILKRIM